jgi:hypothetical protein
MRRRDLSVLPLSHQLLICASGASGSSVTGAYTATLTDQIRQSAWLWSRPLT